SHLRLSHLRLSHLRLSHLRLSHLRLSRGRLRKIRRLRQAWPRDSRLMREALKSATRTSKGSTLLNAA
ncbi:MAG: hypothetical protein ACXWX1_12670, partial [Aeromicrobium sp.]